VSLQRVIVAGTSGVGKTTTAGRISRALDLPYTEIDGLFWGPEWQHRATFEQEVDAFTSQPRWVIEWQYTAVRPLLAARADTLVWLRLPKTTVMRRLTRRTLTRRLRRQELWNGNTEPPLRTIFTDPDHIIRWGWRTFPTTDPRVRQALTDNPHLQLVELRSQRAIDAWLEAL
jgi:adenylate kinase family enzyme